jgi:hypothetical protein
MVTPPLVSVLPSLQSDRHNHMLQLTTEIPHTNLFATNTFYIAQQFHGWLASVIQ